MDYMMSMAEGCMEECWGDFMTTGAGYDYGTGSGYDYGTAVGRNDYGDSEMGIVRFAEVPH